MTRTFMSWSWFALSANRHFCGCSWNQLIGTMVTTRNSGPWSQSKALSAMLFTELRLRSVTFKASRVGGEAYSKRRRRECLVQFVGLPVSSSFHMTSSHSLHPNLAVNTDAPRHGFAGLVRAGYLSR